jgi:hypothetical protein
VFCQKAWFFRGFSHNTCASKIAIIFGAFIFIRKKSISLGKTRLFAERIQTRLISENTSAQFVQLETVAAGDEYYSRPFSLQPAKATNHRTEKSVG